MVALSLEWARNKTCFHFMNFLRGNEFYFISTRHTLYDENQQTPLKNPLHVPIGSITRARFKKIKEALNRLIQEIWIDSKMEHSKLGP